MRAAKRASMPRFLRRPPVARVVLPLAAASDPVLIRTVAFVPSYLRRRPH